MFSLKQRNDSWQNLLSGLGTGRDKSTYTHLWPGQTLSADYCEQLYLNDDIAARICELVPYEVLRQGFSITVDDEHFSREGLIETLRDVIVKSRIFGAAFIYVGVDDDRRQEQPLVPIRVKNIVSLNVLTAKDLTLHSFYTDPNRPNFGQPELYHIAPQDLSVHGEDNRRVFL